MVQRIFFQFELFLLTLSNLLVPLLSFQASIPLSLLFKPGEEYKYLHAAGLLGSVTQVTPQCFLTCCSDSWLSSFRVTGSGNVGQGLFQGPFKRLVADQARDQDALVLRLHPCGGYKLF